MTPGGCLASFRRPPTPLLGRYPIEDSGEPERLVDGAFHPAAHLRPSPGDVDGIAYHHGAHSMPGCEHRRVALPAVGCGIVRFILAVDPVRPLSAHDEDAVAIPHCPVAGARGRDRCSERPLIRPRIVRVMKIGVRVEGVDAPAYEVDHAVDGHNPGVVPGERHRLPARVRIGSGIIDEVPVDGPTIVRSDGASDQMHRVTKRDAGDRAAGLGQTPQRVPAFAVEGECAIMWRAVLLEEASESVQPVPESRDPDVVRPAG